MGTLELAHASASQVPSSAAASIERSWAAGRARAAEDPALVGDSSATRAGWDPFHPMSVAEAPGLGLADLVRQWMIAARQRLASLEEEHPVEAGRASP
jgi:hypothetical protein